MILTLLKLIVRLYITLKRRYISTFLKVIKRRMRNYFAYIVCNSHHVRAFMTVYQVMIVPFWGTYRYNSPDAPAAL